MIKVIYLFTYFLSGILFLSCVTPKPAPQKRALTGIPEDKVGKKNNLEESKISKNNTTEMQNTASPTQIKTDENSEYNEFYERHSDLSIPFSEKDNSFVSNSFTHPTEPRSIKEAVLAIFIIKTVLHPEKLPENKYEEIDLYSSPQASPLKSQDKSSVPSLETVCRNRNFDLAKALETNLYLRNHTINEAVLEALNQGQPSEKFKQTILSSLKTETGLWMKQANKLGMLDEKALATVAAEEKPTTALPVSNEIATEANTPDSDQKTTAVLPLIASDDEKTGENVLNEAQRLASSGKYKEAVQQLKRIPSSHRYFKEASDKMKAYSNSAVKTLRQQAARDFQNSLAASEISAQLSYLEKAKTYLESALGTFPEADDLSTVKNNLEMITNNINRLKLAAKDDDKNSPSNGIDD